MENPIPPLEVPDKNADLMAEHDSDTEEELDTFQHSQGGHLEEAFMEDKRTGIHLVLKSRYYDSITLMENLLIARDKIFEKNNNSKPERSYV